MRLTGDDAVTSAAQHSALPDEPVGGPDGGCRGDDPQQRFHKKLAHGRFLRQGFPVL